MFFIHSEVKLAEGVMMLVKDKQPILFVVIGYGGSIERIENNPQIIEREESMWLSSIRDHDMAGDTDHLLAMQVEDDGWELYFMEA